MSYEFELISCRMSAHSSVSPSSPSVPWDAHSHPGTMGEAGVGHQRHLWQGERRVGQCDPTQSHPKVNIKEGGDGIIRGQFPK